MAMTRRTAGEYLLEKGLITQEQLEDARRIQQSTGKELIQIFLDQTLVSERDAYEAKAFELGMPFVDLDRVQPEPSAHECRERACCEAIQCNSRQKRRQHSLFGDGGSQQCDGDRRCACEFAVYGAPCDCGARRD
jgi:hypothetical protein